MTFQGFPVLGRKIVDRWGGSNEVEGLSNEGRIIAVLCYIATILRGDPPGRTLREKEFDDAWGEAWDRFTRGQAIKIAALALAGEEKVHPSTRNSVIKHIAHCIGYNQEWSGMQGETKSAKLINNFNHEIMEERIRKACDHRPKILDARKEYLDRGGSYQGWTRHLERMSDEDFHRLLEGTKA